MGKLDLLSKETQEATQYDTLLFVRLADIDPDPGNQRSAGSVEDRADLTASIKTHGVIQPITLRMNKNGRYALVAGERRWRSSAEAGLERIPAIVRDIEDIDAVALQVIENTHRKNLSLYEMFEQVQRLKRLMPKSDTKELARKLGINTQNINRLEALMREDNRALLLEGLLPDEGGLAMIDKFDTLPLSLKRSLISFKRQVNGIIMSKDLEVYTLKAAKVLANEILDTWPDIAYLALLNDMTLLSIKIKNSCQKLSKMPVNTCESRMWKSITDYLVSNKKVYNKESYFAQLLMQVDTSCEELIKYENNAILSKALTNTSPEQIQALHIQNKNAFNETKAKNENTVDWSGIPPYTGPQEYELVRSVLTEELTTSNIDVPEGRYNMSELGQVSHNSNTDNLITPSKISFLRNTDSNPVTMMGKEPVSDIPSVSFDKDTFQIANTLGLRIKYQGEDYIVRISKA
jgi:ParB/RepB/Spo0J family partition protein